MNRSIDVGVRTIGDGQPTFVAAEIGINHNGDLDLAHRMIEAAAAAGADGVKFQNFRAEDFIADPDLTYEYESASGTVVESQLEMFRRYEMGTEWLSELKQHCEEAGVVFFSTPTSSKGLASLVELETRLLKNGSDYLGHLSLIRAMAASGIPTVLSTGMATMDEVADAVAAFSAAGGQDLVLLQCTSVYPTPPKDVNLRQMVSLQTRFDCLVGFSDHSEGVVAATVAVALGACLVEKHFTLDKGMRGPDHRFSADPSEWEQLVGAIRECEVMLGSPVVMPASLEEDARRDYRLSCVASRDLDGGRSITEDDIAFSRPGNGILPKDAPKLLGRTLREGVTAGHVFGSDDFV